MARDAPKQNSIDAKVPMTTSGTPTAWEQRRRLVQAIMDSLISPLFFSHRTIMGPIRYNNYNVYLLCLNLPHRKPIERSCSGEAHKDLPRRGPALGCRGDLKKPLV